MTEHQPPDLRELIGDEGDERLARVHELLVAAGPPPREAPALRALPRRRRWTELALAATLVAAALAIGVLIGGRADDFEPAHTVAMHGVGPAAAASAELAIAEPDESGNIAIEMRVDGLRRLPRGGWYELNLSKSRVIGASCGTFVTTGDETTVRLNVGYDLGAWREAGLYDGWVVTAHIPGDPGSRRRILLTT